jgi:sulfotransferase
MTKKTIFVSGLPRALTTLMCNTLANNPRIGGGETSPLLEYVYAARANYSNTPEAKSALTQDLMKQGFLNFCRKGIEGYSEAITEKEIYLDKSRGWLHYADFLWELNPDAKIIVMVRDIRGICSSLEKKWRANPEILDSRDQPNIQDFITVDQRVNHFLNDPPLGIALKRLFNANQTGTLKKMLVIRAEDFSINPEKTMRSVYEYINEPYFDMDYSNVQQVTIENDRIGDFGIYGDHKIRKDIQPLEKDSTAILGTQICNQIKANFTWFYETFKYY